MAILTIAGTVQSGGQQPLQQTDKRKIRSKAMMVMAPTLANSNSSRGDVSINNIYNTKNCCTSQNITHQTITPTVRKSLNSQSPHQNNLAENLLTSHIFET